MRGLRCSTDQGAASKRAKDKTQFLLHAWLKLVLEVALHGADTFTVAGRQNVWSHGHVAVFHRTVRRSEYEPTLDNCYVFWLVWFCTAHVMWACAESNDTPVLKIDFVRSVYL